MCAYSTSFVTQYSIIQNAQLTVTQETKSHFCPLSHYTSVFWGSRPSDSCLPSWPAWSLAFLGLLSSLACAVDLLVCLLCRMTLGGVLSGVGTVLPQCMQEGGLDHCRYLQVGAIRHCNELELLTHFINPLPHG